MSKLEVQVNDVPVRYGGVTYPAGSVFLADDIHLDSMKQVVTVIKEIDDSEKPVEDMKIEELKDFAIKNNVDLGAATKKEEILAAIQATKI